MFRASVGPDEGHIKGHVKGFVKEHVNCLEPLVDLLKDEAVQEKIDEVARLFYSNDTVTINLYWAAAAALLTLLREYLISYDCHY